MTTEEKNMAIASMVKGINYKTEVTKYEYGMDYRSGYEKTTIYSNMPPKLVSKEDKFGSQLLATYVDYFESEEQEEGFKWHYGLSYDTDANWQYEAIEWIEKDKKYRVSIAGNNCWINKMDYGAEIIATEQDFEGSKKEAIFEVLYQFSQYIKNQK